jgi:hypothetical protein
MECGSFARRTMMPCCKNRLERGIFQRDATRVSARCQTRFAENNVSTLYGALWRLISMCN